MKTMHIHTFPQYEHYAQSYIPVYFYISGFSFPADWGVPISRIVVSLSQHCKIQAKGVDLYNAETIIISLKVPCSRHDIAGNC